MQYCCVLPIGKIVVLTVPVILEGGLAKWLHDKLFSDI